MVRLPKYRSPTPPGEMLVEEFMRPIGLSQNALARHLNWSVSKVNEICTGKRGISAETALTLSEVFGTSPDFWLNLQLRCDLWEAMQTHKPAPILPPALRTRSGVPREDGSENRSDRDFGSRRALIRAGGLFRPKRAVLRTVCHLAGCAGRRAQIRRAHNT